MCISIVASATPHDIERSSPREQALRALGYRTGHQEGLPVQHHAELVAPDATHGGIRQADDREAQCVGGLEQHGVAGGVALRVVDLLEAVDVAHDDGDVLARDRRAVEHLPQLRVEHRPVAETGERIARARDSSSARRSPARRLRRSARRPAAACRGRCRRARGGWSATPWTRHPTDRRRRGSARRARSAAATCREVAGFATVVGCVGAAEGVGLAGAERAVGRELRERDGRRRGETLLARAELADVDEDLDDLIGVRRCVRSRRCAREGPAACFRR